MCKYCLVRDCCKGVSELIYEWSVKKSPTQNSKPMSQLFNLPCQTPARAAGLLWNNCTTSPTKHMAIRWPNSVTPYVSHLCVKKRNKKVGALHFKKDSLHDVEKCFDGWMPVSRSRSSSNRSSSSSSSSSNSRLVHSGLRTASWGVKTADKEVEFACLCGKLA